MIVLSPNLKQDYFPVRWSSDRNYYFQPAIAPNAEGPEEEVSFDGS
jgi:hypothetical protein